jgi:hypothetical protein
MQGGYRYERNGDVMAMDESFAIDGSSVRGVRDQPGGARMEVGAFLDTHGLVDSFVLRWTHRGEGHVPSRTISYARAEGGVDLVVDDVASHLETPGDALVFPLLRVFQGPLIMAIASAGEAGRTVVIPDLHAITDPARLLFPTVEVRTARRLAEPTAEQDALYTYEGRVYDADARFWINEATGALTSYRFPQGEGVVFDCARFER